MRALLASALVLLVAAPVAAQSDAKAKAKAAFERAVAAEHDKDWHTAITEFQTAYDLSPHADVLFNIAVDFERLEELRDAATYYRRYLDEKPDASDRAKVEKLIAALRARPGDVTVTSDPSGAKVSVDGVAVGTTPWTGPLAGAHHVTVVGPGGTREEDVVVEFGEPRSVDVAVVPRSGVLAVRANVPGAQVTVDGQAAGVAPLELTLPAGSHRVLVTAAGWASYERPVDVPSEGSTQMTANLIRPLGWIEPAPSVLKGYYIAASGGVDGAGGAGGLGEVVFGAERGRVAGALGYGAVGPGYGFALEARVDLTRGRVRPYVRATLLLGASSAVWAAVGVSARVSGGAARAQVSLFADAGAGVSRDASTDARSVIVPIVGGVQLTY